MDLESGLLREEEDDYVLNSALPPFAIATRLYDSLMARLDRLPPGAEWRRSARRSGASSYGM
jgi:hypothetical protein